MKIRDPYTARIRNVKELKVVKYSGLDKKGKPKNIPYVEFTVIGNNGSWKNAMSLLDFKRLNPQVNIK